MAVFSSDWVRKLLQLLLVVVSISAIFYWVAMVMIHMIAHYYSRVLIHQAVPQDVNLNEVGVSVLKPLIGNDPNLFDNLITFFNISYPKLELLFCVENQADPAVPMVQYLIETHPNVDATLFIGGENVGLNPKINNLMPAYRAAKYSILLISDSRIRTTTDALMIMVNEIKPDDVGMVHQLPFVDDHSGEDSVLEKVHFGAVLARMYLTLNFLGIPTVMGMSTLIKKLPIDQYGGPSVFGSYLQEDHYLSSMLHAQGWKIKLSSQPAYQNSGKSDLKERLQRWAKLLVSTHPQLAIMDPLSHCIPLGIVTSLSLKYLLNVNPILFFSFHFLAWVSSDWTLMRYIQVEDFKFGKLQFMSAWLHRELIALYLYPSALWNPEVSWGGGKYKLLQGGLIKKFGSRIKHV